MSQRPHLAVVIFILAVYFGLAAWNAATTYIWTNEAWFASPAFTLVHKGYLGTTIFDSAGTWMDGIERRTYWMPPLYLLLQAAWYQLFGFSLLAMRSISVVGGAVVILAWYSVVLSISRRRTIALLAAAVVAIDLRFILFASLGRPDMLCAALGALGLAAYLHYRKSSLRRAVLIAHGLAAASCLVHPCGLLYLGGLLLFMLYYDRHRIGVRDFVFSGLPYAIGLGAWGIYILQAPTQFLHQFTGNVSGIASEFANANRWRDIGSPLLALKREFFLRYGSSFGWYGHGFMDRAQLAVLLIYAVAIVVCVLAPRIRNHTGYRALLLLGCFDYLALALLDGLKASAYLVHTLPLCAALLAISVIHFWPTARVERWRAWALASLIGVLGVVQLGTTVSNILDQPQRQDYEAAVAFLRRAQSPSPIIGAGELAFALGFDSGLVDDLRLGYFTGKRPELIVANAIYRGWFDRSAVIYPDIHRYVVKLLAEDYRVVFRNASYTIYPRTVC